jgi:hypothetical protein
VLSWTGVFADSMCNLSSSNNAAKLSHVISASEQTRFGQPIREGMFVRHSIFAPSGNPAYRLVHRFPSLIDEAALVPESNTLVLTGIGIVGIVFLMFLRKVKALSYGGRL